MTTTTKEIQIPSIQIRSAGTAYDPETTPEFDEALNARVVASVYEGPDLSKTIEAARKKIEDDLASSDETRPATPSESDRERDLYVGPKRLCAKHFDLLKMRGANLHAAAITFAKWAEKDGAKDLDRPCCTVGDSAVNDFIQRRPRRKVSTGKSEG